MYRYLYACKYSCNFMPCLPILTFTYYTSYTHTHVQHPGVVAASYYLQETISMDPDGVVLIWDLKFNKDTPDYVFNCHVSACSEVWGGEGVVCHDL